jgi:hypothetical protein
MDRDELIAELEALKPEIERLMLDAGADEPDWGPLETALPMKWCDGFMYMGCFNGVHDYKHGLTRRSLQLDDRCRAYTYDSRRDRYREIPLDVAIDYVFEDIEAMGYTRETALTEEVMEERRQRIADAGWTTITVTPSSK